MGLISKIKQFWKNRKIQTLPEGQYDASVMYTDQQSGNSLFQGMYQQKNYQQPSKLDINIERWLNEYYQNIENAINIQQPIDNYRIAYASLVSLNGEQVNRRCL